MNFLFLLFVCVASCSCTAIPAGVPGDNRNYVEGKSRYIWMSDKDGTPLLVDLAEPVDYAALSTRSGTNNQYWLYTRQNPTTPQWLEHNNLNSVMTSNYNGNRGLAVLVHGWRNDLNSNMNLLITEAYLGVHDVNVIVVDWSHLANDLFYPSVAARVPDIGTSLGQFLLWLTQNAGGDWNNVHLIGFSLGAHVVGAAGLLAGGRAARITGLDPAGPTFGGNPYALNQNCAQYVEAIHTDGKALGIFDISGHTDFYPNGGRHPQPGCPFFNNICSHSRAPQLFAASIWQVNRFVGRRCVSQFEVELSTCSGEVLHMGNSIINKTGTGIYTLVTGNIWPF